MDLAEILRVLRNRWYIVLPLMLLTAGLAITANYVVPTKYDSCGTISLLSAERATTNATKGNANPFLTFDSSLVATADFLSRSLTSNESKAELVGLGVTDEYTAALADNAQGPFITLCVTGTNSDKVLQSTALLADFAARKLREIQAGSGVKPEDMVRLTEITPAQTPEAKMKDKLEIVIGAAGAGTVFAFGLTFIIEGLARSRRRPTWGAPQPVTTATAGTAGGVPPRATTAAGLTETATITLSDATVTLPRIPVEFHEPPAPAAPVISAKATPSKTKKKPAQATTEGETELLPLSPNANGVAKPASGKESTWSTVYRSNGKAGPQDADPAAGN